MNWCLWLEISATFKLYTVFVKSEFSPPHSLAEFVFSNCWNLFKVLMICEKTFSSHKMGAWDQEKCPLEAESDVFQNLLCLNIPAQFGYQWSWTKLIHICMQLIYIQNSNFGIKVARNYVKSQNRTL